MKRLAAVLLMAAACRAGPAPLRLGTTYTVQQSGALAVLESLWTGPAPLTTVVAPSGQILRAAANGDLDVVITHAPALEQRLLVGQRRDRKSTRLNSSHSQISYAVFCLKKKKKTNV